MDGLLVNINDLTVEVRNSNLNRVGVITPKYLDFKAQTVHNGVGQWELTLPASHPMASVLATPGSGIVVSLYGATKFSGPTTQPARSTDRENPDGSYTFTGVTDDVLLADALAYPQPSNSNPVTQTTAYDIRSGNAETVMRDFVSANIGPTAPAGRKTGFRNYIELDPTNLGRGTAIVKSARFDNLGALLGEIATVANLGFQIVQRGSMLRFEVLTITDRSASVRLNVQNGNISRETLVVSPPEVTRVVVAGQGEGVARQFVERTTTDSTAAEAAWGRRIEVFKDQRNTDNTTELQQAGDKLLLDAGFTATAVKAIPADAINMMYGKDWEVGDTVGLVTFGQETKAVVTAAVILVNKETVSVGASIGDVTGFDASNAQAKRVEDTARRVDALEKSTPKNAFGIVDLSDVAVTSPSSGQALIYNSTTSKWTNGAAGASQLSALSDVTVSSPANNQTLVYNSTTGKWTNANPSSDTPAGAIVPWVVATAPSGWLMCNGAAVSRTTYATLFSVIGTTYGAGDGSTTFNVPDLRGRVAVGQNPNDATFTNLGANGGEKAVTLTESQIPSHTHNNYLNDPGHSHGQVITANSGGPGIRWDYRQDGSSYSYPQGVNTYTSGTGMWITNVAAGGGQSHNNLQPYLVTNYIIKTTAGTTAADSQLAVTVAGVKASISNVNDVSITSPTQGQVLAYNTSTGKWTNSDQANSDPVWNDLVLQNGWVSYNLRQVSDEYTLPQYTKRGGIVQLKGLIIGGTATSGTVIANLPAGFRPDTVMVFHAINNDAGREVRVAPNGDVSVWGFSSGWASLEQVTFPAAGVASWTTVGSAGSGSSLANGWSDFAAVDGQFGTVRYWRDPDGIVWWAGMMRAGTLGNLNCINMPSGFLPPLIQHTPALCNGSGSLVRIHPSSGASGLQFYGPSNAYVSLAPVRNITPLAMSNLTWRTPTLASGSSILNAATYTSPQFATTSYGLTHTIGLINYSSAYATTFLLPSIAQRANKSILGLPRSDSIARTDVIARFPSATGDIARKGALVPQVASGWYSFDGLALFGETAARSTH